MYPPVSLLLLLSPLLLFVVLLGQLVSAIPIDSSASLPSCEPGLRAGTVTSQLRLPVSMAVAALSLRPFQKPSLSEPVRLTHSTSLINSPGSTRTMVVDPASFGLVSPRVTMREVLIGTEDFVPFFHRKTWRSGPDEGGFYSGDIWVASHKASFTLAPISHHRSASTATIKHSFCTNDRYRSFAESFFKGLQAGQLAGLRDEFGEMQSSSDQQLHRLLEETRPNWYS